MDTMIKVFDNVKESINYLKVGVNDFEVISIEDFEDNFHLNEDDHKVVKDNLVNIHKDIINIKDMVVENIKVIRVDNEVSMDVMDMVKNVTMTNNKIIND